MTGLEDFLNHIDFIRPLLTLSLDSINILLNIYNLHNLDRNNVKVPLRQFSLDTNVAVESLQTSASSPLTKNSLQRLVMLLSYKTPNNSSTNHNTDPCKPDKMSKESKVLIIDILTVLAIVVPVSLEIKLELLFSWYNFSEEGFMNELELQSMILRVGTCLQKLKLIGSIDLSRDDAENIAYRARAYMQDNVIRFKSGLRFDDFCCWVKRSEECSIFNKVFSLINRLVSTIAHIDKRASTLLDRAHIKFYQSKPCYPPVPSIAKLNLVELSESPILIHISDSASSLCVQAVHPNCNELFALVEYAQTNSYSEQSMLHLENKKFYFHFPLSQFDTFQSTKSEIITISNLDPGVNYYVTVYSKEFKYPKIQCKTLPRRNIENASVCDSAITILSSSISAQNISGNLPSLTTSVDSNHFLFFTGPILPVDDIIAKAVKIKKADEKDFNSSDFIESAVEYRYRMHWHSSVTDLFSQFHGNQKITNLPKTQNKNLYLYPGSRPWETFESEASFHNLFVNSAAYTVSLSKLDNINRKGYSCFMKPMSIHCIDSLRVVLLSDPINPNSGCLSVDQFTRMISSNSSELQGATSLILVVRSPVDLMRSIRKSNDLSIATATQHDTNSVKPTHQPRITGRYELVHGEHVYKTAETPSNIVDESFNELISALSKWIRGNETDSLYQPRLVNIIATSWFLGRNIAIKSQDEKVRIDINSLLKTAKTEETDYLSILNRDIVDYNAKLCSRMENSLPLGFAFHNISSSENRSVSFYRSSSSWKVLFHLVNRLDKKLVNGVSQIKILADPWIKGILNNNVTVAIIVKGLGNIKCSLYELPTIAGVNINMAVLLSERDRLKEITQQTAQSYNETKSFEFQASSLSFLTKYCFVFEFGDSIAPRIVIFCTPPSPTTLASSSTIALLDKRSMDKTVTALTHYYDRIALSKDQPLIYMMTDPENVNELVVNPKYKMLSESTLVLRVSAFNRRKRITESTDGCFCKKFNVTISGKFCKIAPEDDSSESLKNVIEIISEIMKTNEDISNIVVFLSTPIIPFLSYNPEISNYDRSGLLVDDEEYTSELINLALKWKMHSASRDFIIISNSLINEVKCVKISNRFDHRDQYIRNVIYPFPSYSDSKLSVFEGASCIYRSYEISCVDKSFESIQFLHINDSKPSIGSSIFYIDVLLKRLASHQNSNVNGSHFHFVSSGHYKIKALRSSIVVGPMVGVVTQSTARIIIEVNQYMPVLTCCLQVCKESVVTENKSSVDSTSIKVVSSKVDPFKVVVFEAANLKPGMLYKIYFPELFPNLCFGKFRTLSKSVLYHEIAIVSGSNVRKCKNLNKTWNSDMSEIIGQVNNQGTFNCTGRLIINDILSYLSQEIPTIQHQFVGLDLIDSRQDIFNIWSKFNNYASQSFYSTSCVFHVGSHSLLTGILPDVVESLLNIGRNLSLKSVEEKVNDSTGSDIIHLYMSEKKTALNKDIISVLKYSQFKELVRNTFRILLSHPELKATLASNSHFPIFHSDYLFPVSHITIKEGDKEARLLLEIIRCEYKEQVQNYIMKFQSIESDQNEKKLRPGKEKLKPKESLTRVWKNGGLAVVSLDNSTLRQSTEKEESKVVFKLDENGSDTSIPASFSSGFIDNISWNIILDLSKDDNISHIVIISEHPFLLLNPVSIAGESVLPGDILPWKPSSDDLKAFFEYWVEWMLNKTLNKGSDAGESQFKKHRSVSIVSQFNFPYTTTLQHVRTGLKIQQMCIGNNDSDIANHNEHLRESLYILSGKIETSFLFRHRFDQHDDFHIDSSPNSEGLLDTLTSSDEKGYGISRENGFGILRIWLDNWRSAAVWKHVSSESQEDDANAESTNSPEPKAVVRSSKLILGPIVGAMRLIESQKKCIIPILFEVDKTTDLKLSCTNVFSTEVTMYSETVPAHRPIVIEIGPIDMESRFLVQIVDGVTPGSLKSSHASIYINTQIHWSESNIAFVNHEPRRHPDEEKISKDWNLDVLEDKNRSSSEFYEDIVRRANIPFNGITAVAHLNLLPDLDIAILESRDLTVGLTTAFVDCKAAKMPSHDLLKLIDYTLERIRKSFRDLLSRPVLRELFSKSSNLFVPTSQPVEWKNLSWFNVENQKKMIHDSNDFDRDAAFNYIMALMIARVCQEYLEQVNSEISNNSNRNDSLLGSNPITPTESKKIEKEKHRRLCFRSLAIMTSSEAEIYQQSRTIIPRQTVPQLTKAHEGANLSDVEVEILDEVLYEDIKKLVPSDYTLKNTAAEAIFFQFMQNLRPCPLKWYQWLSPNRRTSIELLPRITKNTLPAIRNSLLSNSIENGVRIVVFSNEKNDPNDLSAASSLSNASILIEDKHQLGASVHEYASTWIDKGLNRQMCFVSPVHSTSSSQQQLYGSSKFFLNYTPGGNTVVLHTVDSTDRSNAHDRRLINKANERRNSTSNTNPRQQLLNENKRRERENLADLNQLPDGYLIVECRTVLLETPKGDKDVVSSVEGMILGSLKGGYVEEESLYQIDKFADRIRPSLHDYLQLPEWFEKFYPIEEGVFVQDEIYLLMRQDPDLGDVIREVESEDFVEKVISKYQTSRLSELSKPDDLREVDMTTPGMIARFLKSLIDQIWQEVIPNSLRPCLVPLTDDFIRSLVLSRAIPNVTLLFSAEVFAKGVQHAILLAATMKTAHDQRYSSNLKYLIDYPDRATILARQDLAKSKKQVEMKYLASKLEDPRVFGGAYSEEIANTLKEENEEDDVESDIGELNKEEEKEAWDALARLTVEYKDDMRIAQEISEEQDFLKAIMSELPPGSINHEPTLVLARDIARTEYRAMQQTLDIVVNHVFNMGITLFYREIKMEALEKERLRDKAKEMVSKVENGPNTTAVSDWEKKERYADSLAYMKHLLRERIALRKKIGPRLTYLSS